MQMYPKNCFLDFKLIEPPFKFSILSPHISLLVIPVHTILHSPPSTPQATTHVPITSLSTSYGYTHLCANSPIFPATPFNFLFFPH